MSDYPELTLHYSPGTVAATVALAAHELDIPLHLVRVDFASGAQTKGPYLALNPKGRVPALVTPQGVLSEVGAILDYLARLNPSAGFVPRDAFEAAQMRSVLYYLASTMHVNHAHRVRGSRWADLEASIADMKAKVPETMAECCAYLEADVVQGTFVMGDTMSLADPYLFVVCTWLKGDGVDIANYPKLAAHFEAFGARASVAAMREAGVLS